MIIEFITQYWWQMIILVVLGTILIASSIEYWKQIIRKIRQEIISFISLCISLTLTIISFITQPQAIPLGSLSLIGGEKIKLVLPITLVLIIMVIISLLIFFRKDFIKAFKK